MTDADALSELVRVGLRNPARITVKVQSKKLKVNSSQMGEIIEERRIPAKCVYIYIYIYWKNEGLIPSYILVCRTTTLIAVHLKS
jgi:hypothetical protein